MTREEQIENIAIIADNIHSIDCFKAGVKWADSHPNWHKYPEDIPPEPKDEEYPYDRYIVSDEFGVHEAIWDGEGFRLSVYSAHSKNVVAWLDFPYYP